MTELTFADPCVLFALRREASAFGREFRPQQVFPGAPCRARFCGPSWLTVLVVETGMGAAAVETALRWLLAGPVLEKVPYRPGLVLAAGSAGALQEGLTTGDIVLATEVVDAGGGRWPATWPETFPTGKWQPSLHPGRVLTMPALVAEPAAKAELGRRFEAAAVDMESATAARLCAERGVPFGCVRVISDDLHTPLEPGLAAMLKGGRVSPWRCLTALARSPRLAGAMWRLAKQTRRAGEQLGLALGELLTLTLPWSAELSAGADAEKTAEIDLTDPIRGHPG